MDNATTDVRETLSSHLLNRDELAERLGPHSTRATLDNLAQTGSGPAYQIVSGVAVYHWPTVVNWIRVYFGELGVRSPAERKQRARSRS